MTDPADTDSVLRHAVVTQVRRRQKIWFVSTLFVLASLIAALLMAAVGSSSGGRSTMPSLHYAPSNGFSFGVISATSTKKFDDGEVLLPGGGEVSCGVAYTATGKADGDLSCDWTSFYSDPDVNTLLPTEFMQRHHVESGKDGGQWCITATAKGSTAGAPTYQIECGTQVDEF